MAYSVLKWFFPIFLGMAFGALAMILHEAGHLSMALALGIKVKHVGLRWKGLYTIREVGSPARNLVATLAGPLTNAVLMAFWHWSPTFGLANFCFALCNILPIEGSDGDRALRCWQEMRSRVAP